jgi:hypothetical protein
VGIVPSADPGATNPFTLSASLVGWLTVAVLWIPTAYFLVRMRHIELPALERQPATHAAISGADERAAGTT